MKEIESYSVKGSPVFIFCHFSCIYKIFNVLLQAETYTRPRSGR